LLVRIAAIPIGREARIPFTEVERLLGQQRAGLMALFSGYGVTLTRLSAAEDNTPEQELSEDVRTSSAAFAGRLYGLCSRKHQALIACAKEVLTAKAQE